MASVIKAGNATDGVQVTSDNTGILELKTGTGSGTTAMTLNASQNVGIGTNAPANILDVSKQSGTAWLTAPSTISAAGENYFNISVSGKNSAGTAYEAVRLGFSHDVSQASAIRAGAFTVSTHYSGTLTERLRLDSSGNLGLGVTPSAWSGNTALQAGSFGAFSGGSTFGVALSSNAYSTSAGWAARYIGNTFATLYAQQQTNGQHAWYIAPSGTAGNVITWTQAMTLDASGNLGIGSTPVNSRRLTINTSGQTDLSIVAASNNYAQLLFGYTGADSKGIIAYYNSDNSMQFYTNSTERARITSAGYSKCSDNGTYYGSTGTFHEFYQSANDTGLAVKVANASYTNNGIIVDASRNTTNNSFYAVSYYNAGAGAYKFRVADSGTVTNTTGTYTTISDIKLKQDIVDASSQWDDIKALRIVKYRLKEYVQNDPDSKPFLGLIAQEVEQVCPSLVEEQEDEVMDEDGKLVKNGEVTKGVKTSILYMKAVKALQEAMARIETLEAEVAALKGAAQ